MRIRNLMLVTVTVITLAVPGLTQAAGAATMSGSSSLSAARFVSSVDAQGPAAAMVSAGSKNISIRVGCGKTECGFNGTVEWGTNYLKIYGIVWGSATSAGEVLMTWDSGGVSYLREAGSAPGRSGVGVDKYYSTSEPGYILVEVCGRPGDCSNPVDP
jgi:hypothetical protein